MAEMMADGVEVDIAFRNAERLEITQREIVDRVIKGSGFTRVREHGTSNPNKHKHNIRACFVYKKTKIQQRKQRQLLLRRRACAVRVVKRLYTFTSQQPVSSTLPHSFVVLCFLHHFP